VLRGFGVRDYFWDTAAEVQHELGAGVSLNGGYYRNWRRNLSATDNLAVTPEDYDPFCITAPVDPRLPGGGGYQVCGLYDVKPSKFGLVENVVTQASHYGQPSVVSDFFGVSFNARWGSGLRVGGGLDTGRSVNDTCFIVDSPQQLLNCRVVTPYKAQTDVKLNWSYPLPADFVVSGIFQNVSGPALNTTWAVSNAQVAPSLGRNLAACGTRAVCTATVTVPLTAPEMQFEEARRMQIDLRLTRIFRLRDRGRLQVNLDGYNLLNGNAVIGLVHAYGPRWRRPTQILDGRLIQLSGQLAF
jgi:hypothetical protein